MISLKTLEIVFKLKKEKLPKDAIIKNIRNLLKLEKENKPIKDKIIHNITNIFELENEDYYKPVILAY